MAHLSSDVRPWRPQSRCTVLWLQTYALTARGEEISIEGTDKWLKWNTVGTRLAGVARSQPSCCGIQVVTSSSAKHVTLLPFVYGNEAKEVRGTDDSPNSRDFSSLSLTIIVNDCRFWAVLLIATSEAFLYVCLLLLTWCTPFDVRVTSWPNQRRVVINIW